MNKYIIGIGLLLFLTWFFVTFLADELLNRILQKKKKNKQAKGE